MIPQYSPDNYIFYPAITISGDRWVTIDRVFSSGLLLLKWFALNPSNLTSIETGLIKQYTTTPLGELIPIDLSASIFGGKEFVQFLSIGRIDLPYQLKVKNPPSIRTSQLIIAEYKLSNSYTENPI